MIEKTLQEIATEFTANMGEETAKVMKSFGIVFEMSEKSKATIKGFWHGYGRAKRT